MPNFFSSVGRSRVGRSLSSAIALLALLPHPAAALLDIRSHWAKDCIAQLSQQQLVSGYPDNTFRPDRSVTRTEFAVLMLNLFPHAPVVRPATSFRDVPSGYWGAQAIRQASERAFFAGYPDGTFRPDQPIPRVQAIAVITNALNPPAVTNRVSFLPQYFNDAAQIPDYAKPAIATSILTGTAVNYPNWRQLNPNRASTRGEIAALMCQASALPGVPTNYVAGGTNLFARTTSPYPTPNLPENVTVAKRMVDGLAPAGITPDALGTRWGFVDQVGNWVVPPELEAAEPFAEGLAAIRQNNQAGFIDTTGEIAIAPQFDEVKNFAEGLAAARIGQQWGFIDPNGNWVIEPQDWLVHSFAEGLARVEQNNRTGFIDATGAWVIPPTYTQAQDFSEGLAAVYDDESERWTYINSTGQAVMLPTFQAAQPFSEGLAGVKIDGKWGFVKPTGEFAIAPQFYAPQAASPDGELAEPSSVDAVQPFRQGLAVARLGKYAGFIDQRGNFVILPQFADAESFELGYARVNVGGRWLAEAQGYIPNTGPVGPYSTRFDGAGMWGYIALPNSF